MNSASYNFAIIGCGKIAQRHAEQIERVGTLVATCDIVNEKADALAQLYNALAFYDTKSLLSSSINFDIAVICTPNGLHARHSIQCLQAGVHVICEKPMALTAKDCMKMIRASQKTGRNLFIVKQNRFNPPVAALKEKLDQHALGKIFSMQLNCFWNRSESYYKESWRGTLELDGGTLFTQFSHFIDLMYWMLGDVKEVKSFMRNYNHKEIIDFEDTGVAMLEFENGTIGTLNYTVNSFEKNMEGSLTLFGEKGTVKIGGQYLNEVAYTSGIHLDVAPSPGKANDYGTYTGSMSNHDKVYNNVMDVLQNNAAVTNAKEAMKTVEIIERIYEEGR
ncbi:MAG: Gfo/Idh/MocA family oxidoreductase [Ginsengibacter sp.]